MSSLTTILTNLRIFKTLAVASLSLTHLFAFDVAHQIRPNGSFETTALSNSCSTIEGANFSTLCNSALMPLSTFQTVSIGVVGKSDGDSIDNGRDLIFDPITEELIRKLFEEKNFNSFTFNSNIIFKNDLFEINYTPYYLIADLYLFNPVFPEISLHAVNRETIRLTRGWTLIGDKDQYKNNWFLSVGTSLFYYEHSYANNVFSLFDLSFTPPEQLISFQSEYGMAGDLAFFLSTPNPYMPKFSFQIKNIGTKLDAKKSASESSVQQSPYLLFEHYTTFGMGKDFTTTLGRIDLNLEIPYSSNDDTIYFENITVGGRYTINLFSIFAGFSSYYQNFALRFDSDTFKVGIGYAREEDMRRFQPTVENSVYTGVEISL